MIAKPDDVVRESSKKWSGEQDHKSKNHNHRRGNKQRRLIGLGDGVQWVGSIGLISSSGEEGLGGLGKSIRDDYERLTGWWSDGKRGTTKLTGSVTEKYASIMIELYQGKS